MEKALEEKPDPGKVLEVAEKVRLLLAFAADLIPDRVLIMKCGEIGRERQSFAMAAAPIFGAVGEDYEAHSMEASIHAVRAEALYHLLEVLEVTEKQRATFAEKREKNSEARSILLKHMGV